MDKVRCETCGGEHDLSEMEPSYTYPDAYLAMPPEVRDVRATVGSDECRLVDGPGTDPRYFLRVLLPQAHASSPPRTGMGSTEFCTRLLEQAHVSLVPGTDVGLHDPERYLRLSYATGLPSLKEAISRMDAWLR